MHEQETSSISKGQKPKIEITKTPLVGIKPTPKKDDTIVSFSPLTTFINEAQA